MSQHYGALLRQFRADRKMRLLDLSRLSELDISYLSRIETGDRPVPAQHICEAIHAVLELSPSDNEILQKAADVSRQAKYSNFLAMGREDGAVIILPGKDILRLLKALKLKPTILASEGGAKM